VTNVIPRNFTAGYNTFSLPVEFGPMNASEVPDWLGTDRVELVSYFNETTQAYQTYSVILQQLGINQTDFPIDPGRGFFVYLNNTSNKTLSGPDYHEPITVIPGYNLVGYNSLLNATAVTAFWDMCNQSIELIARYNATTQVYQIYSLVLQQLGIPQDDFAVGPGDAYFLYANQTDMVEPFEL